MSSINETLISLLLLFLRQFCFLVLDHFIIAGIELGLGNEPHHLPFNHLNYWHSENCWEISSCWFLFVFLFLYSHSDQIHSNSGVGLSEIRLKAASDLDTLLSSRFLITGFELRSTREENLLALDLAVQQQQQ